MAPSPLCPGPAPQPDSLTEPNPGRLLSFRAALWQEGFSGLCFQDLGRPRPGTLSPEARPLRPWPHGHPMCS